jgi:hypothetical protein
MGSATRTASASTLTSPPGPRRRIAACVRCTLTYRTDVSGDGPYGTGEQIAAELVVHTPARVAHVEQMAFDVRTSNVVVPWDEPAPRSRPP